MQLAAIRQSGVSLFEIALAMIFLSLISITTFEQLELQQNSLKLQIISSRISQFADGLKAYLRDNHDLHITGSVLDVSADQLKNDKYLPDSFISALTDVDVLAAMVRRDKDSGKLVGLVYNKCPSTCTGSKLSAIAALINPKTGNGGGYKKPNGSGYDIIGNYGGWKLDIKDWGKDVFKYASVFKLVTYQKSPEGRLFQKRATITNLVYTATSAGKEQTVSASQGKQIDWSPLYTIDRLRVKWSSKDIAYVLVEAKDQSGYIKRSIIKTSSFELSPEAFDSIVGKTFNLTFTPFDENGQKGLPYSKSVAVSDYTGKLFQKVTVTVAPRIYVQDVKNGKATATLACRDPNSTNAAPTDMVVAFNKILFKIPNSVPPEARYLKTKKLEFKVYAGSNSGHYVMELNSPQALLQGIQLRAYPDRMNTVPVFPLIKSTGAFYTNVALDCTYQFDFNHLFDTYPLDISFLVGGKEIGRYHKDLAKFNLQSLSDLTFEMVK